ncbi:MAG: glycosyltransferase, partial [Gemmobacter sp.]
MPQADTAAPRPGIVDLLLAEGAADAAALRRAAATAAAEQVPLPEALDSRGTVSSEALLRAIAMAEGLPRADLARHPPDPRLIDRLGVVRCLALAVAPIRRAGSTVTLAVADPAAARLAAAEFDAAFGRWTLAVAPRATILAAIAAARAPLLARRAEARSPAIESCRIWRARRLHLTLVGLAAAASLAALLAPLAVLTILTIWTMITLAAVLTLRAGALWLALRPASGPSAASDGDPPVPGPLPAVSVIIALYREADIAPRLLRRLGRIDYPRALLDIVIALEADDDATRIALETAPLPGWIRVVTVPPGTIRTKPRALNYALDFCRGSIVGTWDAEDAPDADQIRRVVARFAARPPQVACLQGVLDYYNPRSNWIARCFTIEYAAWFRVVMPGLERLGLPMPLGGTTLFVRRAALEAVGAWDAHNVTEDADLGIRLYRRGYRTEMLDTVTEEEANCRPMSWIRQRSRWIKGHIVTWAVHMRSPRRLWRDLGPRGFAGYQVVFLGAQSQVLLAPFMLSLWLLFLGIGHPVA